MKQLKCGAQQYAWGKHAPESKVAKLIGEADKPENKEKRFAELWIGVHKSLPSALPEEGGALLKDFLAENKDTYLGSKHQEFYKGPTLPFLLKVLSIDMALSIQAHPTRDLAKELHAKDPKNYPDPNHKPELIVALTRFEALCCFRPVKEMLHFIRQSPPLQRLLGKEVISSLESVSQDTATPTSQNVKNAIRGALEKVYAAEQETVKSCVEEQVKLIEGGLNHDADLDRVHEVFTRTNKLFPNDVGLWMMYFLNYLVLQPGDALFLGACEPHAYISGDGVEIMANSDNVVRAGLTPKFKDVSTLLNMLTYDTNALASSRYHLDEKATVQQYQPPSWCDDFSLFAVRLEKRKGHTNETLKLPSVGLGVCVEGKAKVGGKTVEFGSNFVVPVGDLTVELAEGEEKCIIFIGTTNVHGVSSRL